MSIIKHNENRVTSTEVIGNKVFFDNIKPKKGDAIYYRCDSCGHTEETIFRSFKDFIGRKFINNRIYCSKCLRKKTNLEKYGVENLSQSKEIQEKIRQNSIEKYGTEHFLSSKEVRDKINKTNIEKYGNENIFQTDEIKEKSRQTMIKRYGVQYSLQSEELKKKFYNSMREKYGSQYAMHSFEIREKRRNKMQSNIVDKIFDFEHITPLFTIEEFVGINKFYKWKCNSCHTTFEDHLDYGHIPRCPRCNPKKVKVNRKKQEVVKWMKTVLEMKNIEADDDKTLKGYELDIYIPHRKFAIELVSLYWDSESQGKDKNHQIKKISYAASNDIDLLVIFEDEWSIKQKIVKSIIKNRLGLFSRSIDSVKCTIKEVTNKDAKFFYERNHIQGHVNNQINYGLFHESEGFVSCFSISKSRFNSNYQWEITRFANRLNFYMNDSFKILLNHFKEQHSGSIIAYADCRYFDSFIYERAGLKHVGKSEPNYFYTDYLTRYNRLKFQKNKLKRKLEFFDPDLTEWQNMQMNGWDKIWDSGSDVYILE